MSSTINDRGAPSARTDEVMMVQETMQAVGLYSGAIDGIAGPATTRAIRAYKKANHFPVNNQLTEEFIQHLRYET